MKSRLEALLRQRELLREHTQWLEDEIAAERARTGARAPAPATATPPASAPSAPANRVETPEADVRGLHNEVRRGCLLYGFLAVVALGGLVAFIYWKYGSQTDEPLPPEAPPAISPEAASPGAPR